MLIRKYPSVLIFLAILSVFTIAVTAMSQAYGTGDIPTSTIKLFGKTLCLACHDSEANPHGAPTCTTGPEHAASAAGKPSWPGRRPQWLTPMFMSLARPTVSGRAGSLGVL